MILLLSWVFFMLQSQSGGSPHSSPSHGAGCSMPMPIRSTSAGSTPTHTPQDCLAGVGGDVLEAFAQGESVPTPETKHNHYKTPAEIQSSFWILNMTREHELACSSSDTSHVNPSILPAGYALQLHDDTAWLETACVRNLMWKCLCFLGVPRNLRNDLLVAADSITNTMSSLVKELHSGQFI